MATFYWTQDGYKLYPPCQRCGKQQRTDLTTQILTDAELCNCPQEPEPPKQYAEGWVCPKCGRVNAPWVSLCPCYLVDATITTGTTTHWNGPR